MKRMVIKDKPSGTVLSDVETWEKCFIEIDKKKNWKEGKSAYCLARDFTNGRPSSGEESLKAILDLFLQTENIEWSEAYIEHASKFDKFTRPRMQDLGVWGKADRKSFFIGVEAKVDEAFGSKNIKEQEIYINNLIQQGKTTNAGKRLCQLKEDFLCEVEEAVYHKFRYQLLYYLAGSFRENADIIIMPIFSYNSQSQKNLEAYKRFMEGLGFKECTPEKGNIKAAYCREIKAPDNEKREVTKMVYTCYLEKKI